MAGTASKGYWAISKESTPGTAITTPTTFYPVIESNTDFTNEFNDVMEIRGSRQAYRALDGRVAPSATVRALMYPGGAFGKILYGLVGGVSSEAADDSEVAFKHTFADAATLPYFTLERADARSGEGGLLCERVAGAKVESMRINAEFGSELTWECTFQALKKPATAAAVSAEDIAEAEGVDAYPSMNPIVFKGASVSVDGSPNSYFKNLDIEITNTLTRQDALNGSQESYRIFEGGVECTLSGTMVFETLDFYNKLINNTEFALDLYLSGDVCDEDSSPATNYGVHFNWPRVRVMTHSVPFTAGEAVEADVEFRIIFDPTIGASFSVDMTNLDAEDTYNV